MLLKIGEIVKAQGIKGEVKIKPYQLDYSYLVGIKSAYFNSVPRKLRSISLRSGFAYAFIEGVNDRNAAEALVGKTVEIDRQDMPKPKDGEYYIGDIIGCRVILDSGRDIGKVIDIQNFGAADVYTVLGEKTVRFPFLKRLISEININIKLITLNAKRFEEVCVYED